MSCWARPVVGTFLLSIALVHLHLALDFFGSGPNWDIHYLWPLPCSVWRNRSAWPFYSWQNMLVFFALFAWTARISGTDGRTPLEVVYPSLDRKIVGRITTYIRR